MRTKIFFVQTSFDPNTFLNKTFFGPTFIFLPKFFRAIFFHQKYTIVLFSNNFPSDNLIWEHLCLTGNIHEFLGKLVCKRSELVTKSLILLQKWFNYWSAQIMSIEHQGEFPIGSYLIVKILIGLQWKSGSFYCTCQRNIFHIIWKLISMALFWAAT